MEVRRTDRGAVRRQCRSINPSYMGYVCIYQSDTGEAVGMIRQETGMLRYERTYVYEHTHVYSGPQKVRFDIQS